MRVDILTKESMSAPGFTQMGRVDRGTPINIPSHALLTLSVVQVTGLEPGDFVHALGGVHLYLDHLDQAGTQLGREPCPLPRMELDPGIESIFDFTFRGSALFGYVRHPVVRAPLAA